MPKRTRLQQDQHNQRRREIKQEGRKAIFSMKYIKAKYPEIHDEACGIFSAMNERYPGKRDLTRTHEFNLFKQSPGLVKSTTTMLEPHLEIPLIPSNPVSAPTVTTTEGETPPTIDSPVPSNAFLTPTITTTTTEEIPPAIDMPDEEIERIINELRQDPDLASVFDDIELPPVSAYTTVEYTQEEGIPPFDDMGLRLDFNTLGEDLPELNDEEIDW